MGSEALRSILRISLTGLSGWDSGIKLLPSLFVLSVNGFYMITGTLLGTCSALELPHYIRALVHKNGTSFLLAKLGSMLR